VRLPLHIRAGVVLVTAAVVLTTTTRLSGGQDPRQATAQFRAGVDLVYLDVIVRDRRGEPVRNLTADDFVVSEDGRVQSIRTFSFEQIPVGPDGPGTGVVTPPAVLTAPEPTPNALGPSALREAGQFRGRRLMVLYFDLSSMQPEEIVRATAAARDFVRTRSSPADVIAVVSLETDLDVNVDFTADRQAMLGALDRLDGTASQGLEEGTTAEDAGTQEGEFTADESEFNLYNTDRRLAALAALADALAGIEQKKSIVYFSGGLGELGTENQVQLRRAIDRAVRANVSVYTLDTRGLHAFVPGGDASQAGPRGTAAFSGRAMRDQTDRAFGSQDALAALAQDTGGRAVFDSNEFGEVFDRVVADTAAYYMIGYESTNPAPDGRFRRVSVRLTAGDHRIEHRAGYYAPKDFKYFTRQDRERQLEEQLFAELSATDLPLHLTTASFRVGRDRFSVPVTLLVPGSRVPHEGTNPAAAQIDVLGMVLDAERRPVARIRDTLKLTARNDQERRRLVQYQSAFELAPGAYQIKVVARENSSGTMGSFETSLAVPGFDRAPVKVSSVVIGTRLGADDRANPLSRLAGGLVINAAQVVGARDPLYFYFEVYDPARRPDEGDRATRADEVRLQASVSFYQRSRRVYQTPVIELRQLSAADRAAAQFRLEVPPASLAPGAYTCQVNVIDDVAGTFVFPRLRLYVRP
jgi:VWFA-related protein